jgi:pimeloyl-ACP methyl ester carboxylesterase|tara:strand:+ start:82243 stop:83097 length:855 start_codon:yes stop_codon:yes gene_type:complete
VSQLIPSSEVQAPSDPFFAYECMKTGQGDVGLRRCGRGPDTVVLLHGISSGADSWRECASLLQHDMQIIAWDAPGYGESASLTQVQPSAIDYAHRLQGLLDVLDIEHCMVVGHSLGALMASGLARQHDPRVTQFLLISPALGYGGTDKASEVRAGRFAALAEKGVHGMAQALPDRLLSAFAVQAHRQAVTANAMKLNESGYKQAVELLCGDDIYRYADDFPANTRVYCGDADIVTTPEQSAAFAKRLGFPFELISQAGHASYIEQPQQVANLIHQAMSNVRGVA